MKTAFARAKPAKAKGCRKSSIEPKDFEACLYPLIQREAAKDAPANCWDIRISCEDASALTAGLAARFAFDAIEHFVLADPRFNEALLDELTVIVAADKEVKPGDVKAKACWLDDDALASRRAKAKVTKRGVAMRRNMQAEPTLFSTRSSIDMTEGDKAMGIKKFFSALKGTGSTSPAAAGNRWASPDDIIESTLAEIDDKAMNWPDGKDLPDCVTVYLSQADYARYGPRKSASEQHIANKILDYAQECGALLERNPTVRLKVDPLLYCGQMRIDASFSDPAAASSGAGGANTSGGVGAGGDHGGNFAGAGASGSFASAGNFAGNFANRTAGTSGSVPASGALTFSTQNAPSSQGNPRAPRPSAFATPEFKPSSEMRTPEYKPGGASDCAIAKLTGASFQSAVLAGDTIGRIRYKDRPKPTISLDGADFEFVSQEQGTFEHDRDGWWFTSVGRNGTSVQRKGSWTKLTHGVRFALEDGDSISFGKCTPLTFSIAQ